MTRLKVASVFLFVSLVIGATAPLLAAGGKHPSARIFAVSKKWRLQLKPGTKFPVGMDVRMRLTGKRQGKVGEVKAKVTLPMGQKACKLNVLADFDKGRYVRKNGRAQVKGVLLVRKLESGCTLPAALEKKIKRLKADLVLTLRGSTLCPKGETPPNGACFNPDK